MKNKLKVYMPWVLLAVIPSLFTLVLDVLQLYSAQLFFGINWDYGFYAVAYLILTDLVHLCRPLAAICFCILAVMRPFARKREEFMTGMRWITAATLLVFSLSFCIVNGMAGLSFNTGWDWLSNVLQISVIPAAVAYVLIRQEKLADAVRWTITFILVGLMVANNVTFVMNASVTDPLLIGNVILITYVQTAPVLFALAPQKR